MLVSNALVPRVAVCGDVMLDYWLNVGDRQEGDEKRTVISSQRTLGGTASNAAMVLAQLGAEVDIYTTLPFGTLGDQLIEQLEELKIGTQHIYRTEGALPQATIIRSEKSREVFVDRGVTDEQITDLLMNMTPYDLIYVTNPQTYLSDIPRRNAQRIVVNLEHQMVSWFNSLPISRETIDVLLLNEAAFVLLDESNHTSFSIVETQGSQGARIHERSGSKDISTIQVDMVDETGAGDTFAATLCFFLLKGLEIEQACEAATVAAGLCVSRLGTFNPELSEQLLLNHLLERKPR